MAKKVLLCITSGSFETAEQKGVTWMFQDREEDGYFSKSITLHYNVRKFKWINLSPRSMIVEAGFWSKYAGPILSVFLGLFLCLKYRVTVVRATDPFVSALVGYLITRIYRCPFSISIHSDFDLSYKLTGRGAMMWRPLGERIERYLLSRARMVMVIRESLIKYAVKHGARKQRVRVIPHGMDMKPYKNNNRSEVTNGVDGIPVILFVGRLTKENYVEDVINIAGMVCQARPDAIFLMVGDGEESENLERLTETLGISENVIFAGFKNREEVIKAQLMADIGLCLRGGYSLIEMAAAGLPIVSYDVDWHHELIEDGESGLLMGEGDIQGTSAVILELLNNRELATQLGENAKSRAMHRHSLEETSRVKIDCYEELVHGYSVG